MTKRPAVLWNWLAAWAAASGLVWAMLVPATIGLSTVVTLSALILGAGLLTALFWRDRRSTPSIHEMLYEAESRRSGRR